MAKAEEEKGSEQMMVMGLNNYAQLALPTTKALSFFMPQRSKEMTRLAWNCVAIGQHHVIGLEQSGQVRETSNLQSVLLCHFLALKIFVLKSTTTIVLANNTIGVKTMNNDQVYALGRKEYGRLGLGEESEDATVPALIEGGDLAGEVKCLEVNNVFFLIKLNGL